MFFFSLSYFLNMVKSKKDVLKVITQAPSQTKKLGRILAKEILKTSSKRAIVVGLIGDLGGGKTTFLQGFAKGLGIKQPITSPTFVIIRKYKILNSQFSIYNYLYHIDCYRIKKPKEILNLGFKEMILNPQNIVVIEWADKILEILPRDALILDFELIDLKTRQITIKAKS